MPSRTKMQRVEERAWKDIRRGEKVYNTIALELEAKYLGQFVVINLETGEYLVDKDEIDALNLADKKFGEEAPTFYRKIGKPYPHIGFFGG